MRCCTKRFPALLSRRKPWNSLDDETETHTYSAEGDPAGLGVKASHCDLSGAGIPDQDQRGETHSVEQKHERNAEGNEEKRSRKVALLPKHQEPQNPKRQDESNTLQTRALGCNLAQEALRAND